MIETAYGEFLESTVGRYTVTGASFVWCVSPTLCGACLWDGQTEAETRAILHIFDQYPRHMAREFDIVLDTRGVSRVDPSALGVLFSWLIERRQGLEGRLRLQANVIREGPTGFLLTGLLPVARWSLPYRLFYEPMEAFHTVAGPAGAELCAEVEAIAERVRGVPREIRVTREMLATRLDLDVDDVGRALGMSGRSLQRALAHYGTSFRAEMSAARFARAQTLLRTSDQKVAAIADRVGISERALTLLFRAKTGLGPAEWRRRQPR